jgi:hypothetical protein
VDFSVENFFFRQALCPSGFVSCELIAGAGTYRFCIRLTKETKIPLSSFFGSKASSKLFSTEPLLVTVQKILGYAQSKLPMSKQGKEVNLLG